MKKMCAAPGSPITRLTLLFFLTCCAVYISSAQTANDIIERHIEAIGGAAKLSGIKSLELEYMITYSKCKFPDNSLEVKKLIIKDNQWTERQYEDYLRNEAVCSRHEMLGIKYQIVDKMRTRIEAKDKSNKVVTTYNSTNTPDSSWRSAAGEISLLPRTPPSDIITSSRVSDLYYQFAIKKISARLLKNRVISVIEHTPRGTQIDLKSVDHSVFEVAYEDPASNNTVVYSISKDTYYLVRTSFFTGTGRTEFSEDNASLICNYYNHKRDEGVVIPYYTYYYDPLQNYSVSAPSLYHQSLHELESVHINSGINDSVFKVPQ